MALNLEDLERLRPSLRPRIQQAVTKFFNHLIGGGNITEGTPADAGQLEWIRANVPNVGTLADHLSFYVMSETDFINNGTSITDAAISSRVEFVLKGNPAHFIPAAE